MGGVKGNKALAHESVYIDMPLWLKRPLKGKRPRVACDALVEFGNPQHFRYYQSTISRTRIELFTHTYTYIYIHLHTYTYIYIHTYIQKCIHTIYMYNNLYFCI